MHFTITTKKFRQNRVSGICYYCYPFMFSSENNSITRRSPKIIGKYNANIITQPQSYGDSITGSAATITKPKAQASKFVPNQPLQATTQKTRSHSLKFLAHNTPIPRRTSSKGWKNYEPTLREFVPLQPLLVMPQRALSYRSYMENLLSLQPLQKLTQETSPSGPLMPEISTQNWSIPINSATESQKNNGHNYSNITTQFLPHISVIHNSPKSEFVPKILQKTCLETSPCSPSMTGDLLKQGNSQSLDQQSRSCENCGHYFQKMLEHANKKTPLPATTQGVTPYRPLMAAPLTPQTQPALPLTPPRSPNMTENLLKRKTVQTSSENQQPRLVTNPPLKIMRLEVEASDDLTPRAKPYRPNMVAQRSTQTKQSRFAGKTLQTMTQEKMDTSPNMTDDLLISKTDRIFSQNWRSKFLVEKSSIETNLNQISNGQYYANIKTTPISPYSFTQCSQKILEQREKMSRFTSLQHWSAMTQRATPYRPYVVAQLIPVAQHFIQSVPIMAPETPPCNPSISTKYLEQASGQIAPKNQQPYLALPKTTLPINSTVISWEKYRQYYANIIAQPFSAFSFTQPSQKILEQRLELARLTSLLPWPLMTQRATPYRPFMAAQLTPSLPAAAEKISPCNPSLHGNWLKPVDT